MTKLFYFTRTQERRRDGDFVCFGIEERRGLYSSSGKNMNEKSFNEDWQRIKNNHEPKPYFRLRGNLVY